MRALLAAGAALLVALTGCADDGNDTPSAVTAPATSDVTTAATPAATSDPVAEPAGLVIEVIAIDNSFRPEVVEVAVGDVVVWENRGANEHDVLSVQDGGWGVGVAGFQPGDIWSYAFTEPGEYRYYCSIHGNADVGMVGTVIVS